MLALFDLPREVRDGILDVVIETVLVSFPGGPVKLPVHGNPPELSGEHVQYSNFVQADIIPTLLVNRQLHQETQEALDRIRNRASYAMEVEIFEERELRVKWISVPALTKRVDNLTATIFSGGVYRQGVPLFRTEDWSPHGAYGLTRTWAFCSLLVLGYPQLCVRYQNLCDLRSQTGIDYVMRPEYVAEYFHRYIDRTLLQETTSYGALLYERVGRIELLVDSKPYKSFDLAERVASMRYRDRYSDLVKAVAKWKEILFKKRKEYGLPVWQAEE